MQARTSPSLGTALPTCETEMISICYESMKFNSALRSTFKLWVESPRRELNIATWGQILCHYLVLFLSVSSSAAYRLWLAIFIQLLSLSNTSYFHFCQTNMTDDAGELERKDFCTVFAESWKMEEVVPSDLLSFQESRPIEISDRLLIDSRFLKSVSFAKHLIPTLPIKWMDEFEFIPSTKVKSQWLTAFSSLILKEAM